MRRTLGTEARAQSEVYDELQSHIPTSPKALSAWPQCHARTPDMAGERRGTDPDAKPMPVERPGRCRFPAGQARPDEFATPKSGGIRL